MHNNRRTTLSAYGFPPIKTSKTCAAPSSPGSESSRTNSRMALSSTKACNLDPSHCGKGGLALAWGCCCLSFLFLRGITCFWMLSRGLDAGGFSSSNRACLPIWAEGRLHIGLLRQISPQLHLYISQGKRAIYNTKLTHLSQLLLKS